MTAIITDIRYRMTLAIIRDLGERGVRVIGCDTREDPVGSFSKYCRDARVFQKEKYIDSLFDLCAQVYKEEGERPALLVVGVETLAALAEPETSARFRGVCGLLVPTAEAVSVLNDKERVAELGRELGIPVPEEYTPETAKFPCAVKPRCGEKFGIPAAERYRIAKTPEELASFREHFRQLTGEEPIVQQYLPGGGLGCSVIAEEGQIRRAVCHRRIREYPVTGGPSSCCEAFRDEKLEGYAAALMEKTGFSGPCMVEFKLDAQDVPRLLEVNPRVWGTYPLTRAAGAGFSWEWFRLSWNRGNPEKALPPEETRFITGKRMTFAASDMAAAAGYWKSGQKKRALGAVGSLFDPRVADGVWEFGDMKPAIRYYTSLLKRGGEK